MHQPPKQEQAGKHHSLLDVDFHHFIQLEPSFTDLEMATEFGISIQEVRQLKKKLHRS